MSNTKTYSKRYIHKKTQLFAQSTSNGFYYILDTDSYLRANMVEDSQDWEEVGTEKEKYTIEQIREVLTYFKGPGVIFNLESALKERFPSSIQPKTFSREDIKKAVDKVFIRVADHYVIAGFRFYFIENGRDDISLYNALMQELNHVQ